MRCATSSRAYRWPLCWLVGLAIGALAMTTASATEDPAGGLPGTGEPAAGTTDELEGSVTEEGGEPGFEEDLLGDEFDEEMEAINLEEGLVSFALQGANVRDFCNWFADRLEINIVLSPRVEGPMNITLKNVPWEIALRKALETHNYVLIIDENGIYTVLTEDEIALEPLKTEVYTLSYASAAKAKEVIEPLKTERGIVQCDEASNQLIVSDVPAKLAAIEIVIIKLDRQIPLVLIEVKLLEKVLQR